MSDYPKMIAPTNHIEPVPRRVRATLGGQVVLDTRRAIYVWEWPNYPQYYIPLADVAAAVLVDENRVQKLSRGPARLHGLRVGDEARPGCGTRLHRRCSGRPGRHGAPRLGRSRRLVRGGRGGLRPPPQPLHPRRRDSLDPDRADRARGDGAGGVVLTGDGVRDRSADPLLPQSHRGRLRAPASHRHGHLVPLQGHDERLLVGAWCAGQDHPTWHGPTTSRPARCCPSPG